MKGLHYEVLVFRGAAYIDQVHVSCSLAGSGVAEGSIRVSIK